MKNKIITFLFTGYILLFGALHLIIKDQDLSKTERRYLTSFPKIELTNAYVSKIEKYLLDHFPFRSDFRNIKALYNYRVLRRLENNGVYLKNDMVFKSLYPTSEKDILNFLDKTKQIKDLLTEDNKVYLMVIPDKNYYLKDDNFLQIDYDYIYEKIKTLEIEEIDIRSILTLEDYFHTDTHWKQEKLGKVIYQMGKIMGFSYEEEEALKYHYPYFYGVYYSEAINAQAENLTYITSKAINNAKVKYLENDTLSKVYNEDKLKGLDAYEVFLDGASSFIEITNPNSTTDKELVIFRDSFGSSLAPLLISYYAKITLIDNRYIDSNNFLNYMSFNNQDVLFLYSTLLVNQSSTLKG